MEPFREGSQSKVIRSLDAPLKGLNVVLLGSECGFKDWVITKRASLTPEYLWLPFCHVISPSHTCSSASAMRHSSEPSRS